MKNTIHQPLIALGKEFKLPMPKHDIDLRLHDFSIGIRELNAGFQQILGEQRKEAKQANH